MVWLFLPALKVEEAGETVAEGGGKNIDVVKQLGLWGNDDNGFALSDAIQDGRRNALW